MSKSACSSAIHSRRRPITWRLPALRLIVLLASLPATASLPCAGQNSATEDTKWINDRVVLTRIFFAGPHAQDAKEQKREQFTFEVSRNIRTAARADGVPAWAVTYSSATENGKPTLLNAQSFVIDMRGGSAHVSDSAGADVASDISALAIADAARWLNSVIREPPKCGGGIPDDVCRDLSGAIGWAATKFQATGGGAAPGEWPLTATSDGGKLTGVLKREEDGIVIELGERSQAAEIIGSSTPDNSGTQNRNADVAPVRGVGFVETKAMVTRNHSAPVKQ